jgi:hypothetical protein
MEICRRLRSSISRIILGGGLLLLSGNVMGQDRHPLIPDGVVLQHAGSIGFMSIGATYEVFQNKRGNIDALYGFVPKNKGGPLHIVTAKFAYRPIGMKISDQVTVYPLNPGAFFSSPPDQDLSVIIRTSVSSLIRTNTAKAITTGRRPFGFIYLSVRRQ